MFDDNKPCLDALSWLTEDDRRKIFEKNVRKVYPRLDAALDMRQAAPSTPSKR
jgi:4-oxalmesaconate hydratase